MPKRLKKDQVVRILRDKQGGRSVASLAEELGVSRQYLSDVLNGWRDPGPTVLAGLGLKLERLYSEVEQ